SAINASAQIPSAGGNYTINAAGGNTFIANSSTGNFTTFTLAIAALNATGTGTINSNVTFTVTSGTYFENPTIITYTNVNASNPKITFVKAGGADPVISSSSCSLAVIN